MMIWVMVFLPSLGLTFAAQDKDRLRRQKSDLKNQLRSVELTGGKRGLIPHRELLNHSDYFILRLTTENTGIIQAAGDLFLMML